MNLEYTYKNIVCTIELDKWYYFSEWHKKYLEDWINKWFTWGKFTVLGKIIWTWKRKKEKNWFFKLMTNEY